MVLIAFNDFDLSTPPRRYRKHPLIESVEEHRIIRVDWWKTKKGLPF
jgi:hypothetical protein